MKFEQVLKVAVRGGASDIILKVGSFPRLRHQGKLVSLADGSPVTAELMQQWVKALLPARLHELLASKGDVDFGFSGPEGMRFRANLFRQCGQLGILLRVITEVRKTIEELALPQVVSTVAQKQRGLVLVTGATGSG